MILTADIVFGNEKLNNGNSNILFNIFEREIDLFIVACAIGIREDKVISLNENAQPKTIGRNVYNSRKNERESQIINHLLKIALLTSKQISVDEETRIKLAFDPEEQVKGISASVLLGQFANYGLVKLLEGDSISLINKTSDIYYIVNSYLVDSSKENLEIIDDEVSD